MKLSECHPNRKHKAHGLCGSCYDRQLKSENPAYKAKQARNTAAWHEKFPEKTKSHRDRYDLTPEAKRKKTDARLRRRFDIGIDDYDAMFLAQSGGCALCGRKPSGGKALHVDHDHATLKVRGLLCHQCNWYMGTVDADPAILDRIKEYRK